jgi:RNA polymerase sigma factor (sigma-70 family)
VENYSKYTDEQLQVLLKEKEPSKSIAFKILWDRHSNNLMQYCCFKTSCEHDAQDIFQKTWISFYESIVKERRVKSVKGYLFRIACNQVRVLSNSEVNEQSFVDKDIHPDSLIDNNITFLEDMENQEVVANFHLALNLVETPTNEYLLLHYIGGLSFTEIAEMYEDTYDAVRMRCTRGMNKVIEIIKPLFEEKNVKENKI